MRALLKKLETAFGSSTQVRSFGRSEGLLIEIAPREFTDVCTWLRMEESFRLDFLESFTAYESRGKLYFTLFLRSIPIGHAITLRTFVELKGDLEPVVFPTLSRIWPQAVAFETELSPLFGISFEGAATPLVEKDFGTFEGFPLRKHFHWGSENQP